MVSVHCLLAALFLSQCEAQQNGRIVERNRVAHLMAPGSRNLENAWMAYSFIHVYSIEAPSLWDRAAHIQGEFFPLNICPT
jgi:hypothetical protein